MLRMTMIPILAFFLVFTFLAHDAHAGHDHPHALFGSGPSSPLHGENRKILTLLLLFSFFALVWGAITHIYERTSLLASEVYISTTERSLSHDHLTIFLGRGIIHSKVW